MDQTDPNSLPDAEARIDLLRRAPVFGELEQDSLRWVAGRVTEERYGAGSCVIAEGDEADRLFIVADGQAELSAQGTLGPVPLATISPPEIVGELALLDPGRRRNATVEAVTSLVLLSLARADFQELLRTDVRASEAVARHADEITVARLIKHVGPFMTLSDTQRRWLAQRVLARNYDVGQDIVCQGEPGGSCFLLRSGRAEVLLEEGGQTRQVDTIEAGALFGENGLLTDAPRGAGVRALEPCQALELRRADLREITQADQAVATQLVDLLRLRERPRPVPGVLTHERRTPEGDTITILKNPSAASYFRLSPRGRYVWDRLDGQRNLRELTLDYYQAFGEFSPGAIGDILAGLGRTGFLQTSTVGPDLSPHPVARTRWQRFSERALRIMEWRREIPGVPRIVDRAYAGGLRLLFTTPGLALVAAIIVAGLTAFVSLAGGIERVFAGEHKEVLLLLVPGLVISSLAHEGSHALATKAFGRSVSGGGVGWYWFSPITYIDTSDMWLGTRAQRVAVSAAGPCGDLAAAGALSLIAVALADPVASAGLWSMALPMYLSVLINLNPFHEYDGYYILIDLADRPHLRHEAIETLRHSRVRLREHGLELFYALASVTYVVGMAALTILLYRLTLEEYVSQVLPHEIASLLAWGCAVLVVVLALTALIGELRSDPAGGAHAEPGH